MRKEIKNLLSFIDNLEKTQGYLSEDDLYTIGLMYKALDISTKRTYGWKALAKKLNISKTGEQYRLWIVAQQQKDGTLPVRGGDNQLIGSTKSLTGITGKPFDGEHYKKVTELRDYWNAIRADKREEARVNSLKNVILSLVSELDGLNKVTPYKGIIKDKDKEAILLFSDLHIGVKYDSGYNKYNDAIATKRLSKLVTDTKRYCELHQINTLHILNLGDMIQGIIHTNARMYAQYDAITQTMKASELIAQFVNELSSAAPEVTYRSCVDNHARLISKKNENIENENLYRIIDWYVEERLKDTKVKFMKDNIDPSLGKFDLKNGKKVMFAHGHLDPSNKVFQNFIGVTQEFIDYGLVAHKHSFKSKEYQNMNIIVNGSIVGTEQYANSIRAYSKPSQALLVFDGDNLIMHKIDLSTN